MAEAPVLETTTKVSSEERRQLEGAKASVSAAILCKGDEREIDRSADRVEDDQEMQEQREEAVELQEGQARVTDIRMATPDRPSAVKRTANEEDNDMGEGVKARKLHEAMVDGVLKKGP